MKPSPVQSGYRGRIRLFIAKISSAMIFLLSLLRLMMRRKSVWRNRVLRYDLELGAEAQPEVMFSQKMLKDLPPAGKRYFKRTFSNEVQLPRGIRLKVSGFFNLEHPLRWQPMEAEQWIVPESGFLWVVRIQSGMLQVSGADWLLDNRAGQHISLWKLIPIVRAQSDHDVDRSALGRLLIESIMVPTIFLPLKGARWEELHGHWVAVYPSDLGAEHPPVKLYIDDDGRLRRAEIKRWGRPGVREHFSWHTFYVNVLEEREFEGIVLPSRIVAGWVHSDGSEHPFYRAVMDVEEVL